MQALKCCGTHLFFNRIEVVGKGQLISKCPLVSPFQPKQQQNYCYFRPKRCLHKIISDFTDLQQSLWESSAEFINRKTPLHSPINPGWQWQCNKLSIVVTHAFVIYSPKKSYKMTCIFCLFGLPFKSHFWISISCIVLKLLNQICMEKVDKYYFFFWQSKINSDSLFRMKVTNAGVKGRGKQNFLLKKHWILCKRSSMLLL